MYTFLKDEVITEDFSLARDVPLGKAEYTYNILIILNLKPPYETKRLKIQFLVELDAEKAAEKHGMNNVKKFIFKKHPDSGRVHVLSQDTYLFLPYDLTACRHLPFLCSSPRADSQEENLLGPEAQVKFHLEGELIYALTMEKGSHNLIPFSHTRMVIPQLYLSRVYNENWYTYVNDSLANTMGISTSTIQQFRKIFAEVKENIERNHQQ